MSGLFALIMVVLLDLVLSGDNAVVVAAAANGLPQERRNKAILYGIGFAIGLRIILTACAGWLLGFKGVAILGGIALLWIAYKLGQGYFKSSAEEAAKKTNPSADLSLAIAAIVVADLSMSIDNVAAVAALTRSNPAAMIFGLILSVAIMGFGAKAISLVLEKYKWLQLAAAALIALLGLQMALASFFAR